MCESIQDAIKGTDRENSMSNNTEMAETVSHQGQDSQRRRLRDRYGEQDVLAYSRGMGQETKEAR